MHLASHWSGSPSWRILNSRLWRNPCPRTSLAQDLWCFFFLRARLVWTFGTCQPPNRCIHARQGQTISLFSLLSWLEQKKVALKTWILLEKHLDWPKSSLWPFDPCSPRKLHTLSLNMSGCPITDRGVGFWSFRVAWTPRFLLFVFNMIWYGEATKPFCSDVVWVLGEMFGKLTVEGTFWVGRRTRNAGPPNQQGTQTAEGISLNSSRDKKNMGSHQTSYPDLFGQSSMEKLSHPQPGVYSFLVKMSNGITKISMRLQHTKVSPGDPLQVISFGISASLVINVVEMFGHTRSVQEPDGWWSSECSVCACWIRAIKTCFCSFLSPCYCRKFKGSYK